MILDRWFAAAAAGGVRPRQRGRHSPGARSFNYAGAGAARLSRGWDADDVLEMLPLGGRPDLGVAMSVTADDRGYFCGGIAVGGPEDVDVIAEPSTA